MSGDGGGGGGGVARHEAPIVEPACTVGAPTAVQTSGDSDGAHNWLGWGYADTRFEVADDGNIGLSGSRYLFSGRRFPAFRAWAEERLGLDIERTSPAAGRVRVPAARRCQAFVDAIDGACAALSFDAHERLAHAHGHTLQEVWALRAGDGFARVPDAVVWPSCDADVVRIVRAAVAHHVCLLPYGGGTSVSQALALPADERRMVVALDMRRMARILWLDAENMTVKVEAGAVGKRLEAQLAERGYRLGHEPDSYEFSSVGGWVATRASGMKKNVYGNIEDMLVWLRMVTPAGVVEKGCVVPRLSAGPDPFATVLGSEGTLGVVTEVVLRVRRLPAVQEYGSIVFPDFAAGVRCLRELERRGVKPASIRLVDNAQFQFGQVLKPDGGSLWSSVADAAKRFYVTRVRGFDVERMAAATLVFEGGRDEVAVQQQRVYAIAARHHGLKAGAANGIRGYFLTYCIAYLRDLALEHEFIAESFETSVPWSNVMAVVSDVRATILRAAERVGVGRAPWISCRVTQGYASGVCLYFYFGFLTRGLDDPVRAFHDIEDEARAAILARGGSVSHHHGIGKLRKRFMRDTLSPAALRLLYGAKAALDPANLFVAGNLIDYRPDASLDAQAPRGSLGSGDASAASMASGMASGHAPPSAVVPRAKL